MKFKKYIEFLTVNDLLNTILIMSKKCPYCGSDNTEVSVGNYVERGVVNAGRFTIAAAAAFAMGLVSRSHATHAGVHTYNSMDPGEFKGHHCCNCGKDFSA